MKSHIWRITVPILRLSVALLTLSLLEAVTNPAVAQEPAAPAADAAAEPSSYFDMRRSKDVRTRTTAERYLNLTKTQEWTSDKGTKILAKYVAHADDLSSVTLAVVRGSGAARTVKEVTVPTNRLNKACQSRVKQIATLQTKLDELAAQAAAEPADPNQPGGGAVAADPGSPMMDERGIEPRERPVRRPASIRPADRALSTAPAPEAIAPATSEAPAVDDGGDDPLGFGELPAASPLAAGADGSPVPFLPPGAAPIGVPSEGIAPPAATVDPKAWRTDYEAFRANIQVDSIIGIPQVKYGPMKELQAAVDEVKQREADGTVSEEEGRAIQKKLDAIGEVTWEATVTDAEVEDLDWTDRIRLPQPPEPLQLTFFLDETNSGNWQSIKSGDRVRFVGRFVEYDDGIPELGVAIRFPDRTVASGPAVNADPKQWTASYDAFRANFKVAHDERGAPRIDWGELEELRRVGDEAAKLRQDPANTNTKAFADQLAEVRWEAPLKGIYPTERGTRVEFDLSPLPAPLQLEFGLDANEDPTADQWAFSPGDRVSFAGRLAMAGPTSIVVVIREPLLMRPANRPQR